MNGEILYLRPIPCGNACQALALFFFARTIRQPLDPILVQRIRQRFLPASGEETK